MPKHLIVLFRFLQYSMYMAWKQSAIRYLLVPKVGLEPITAIN